VGSQGERDSLVTLVTLVTLWTPIKKGANFDLGEKRVSGVTSVTASRRLSGRGRGLGRLPWLAGCASARHSGGVSSVRSDLPRFCMSCSVEVWSWSEWQWPDPDPDPAGRMRE